MTLLDVLPFVKTRAVVPRQIITDAWDERRQILHPDNNLFVWERLLTPTVAEFAWEVTLTNPASIRIYVSKPGLRDQLATARAQWLDAATVSDEDFWTDVQRLIADFLDFAKSQTGTLHIKVVSDDACTKFHTDGFQLRLFTTYHGPGTEWLPESAVNRAALGKDNQKIVRDPKQIRRMRTGHVGILKGELPYQKGVVKGIVHRSPDLNGAGEKRLIVRVDI